MPPDHHLTSQEVDRELRRLVWPLLTDGGPFSLKLARIWNHAHALDVRPYPSLTFRIGA